MDKTFEEIATAFTSGSVLIGLCNMGMSYDKVFQMKSVKMENGEPTVFDFHCFDSGDSADPQVVIEGFYDYVIEIESTGSNDIFSIRYGATPYQE